MVFLTFAELLNKTWMGDISKIARETTVFSQELSREKMQKKNIISLRSDT